jgi:thioredoxin 1
MAFQRKRERKFRKQIGGAKIWGKDFELTPGRVKFKNMKLSGRVFWVKNLSAVVAALALVVVAGCENPSAMNESTANVKHITQAEFPVEVSQATGAVVVDFYATWCGPCRQLAPLMDKLAGTMAGKIKFFKVNVDESPGLAQNFKIEGIPTVLFFKDGKLADRITGLPTESDLKARLDSLAAAK